MQQLLFATGNDEKFAEAHAISAKAGIQLVQFHDDSTEIQSENPEIIIRDKTAKKFALADNQPVIVSDDSWNMPGLNGFPGAYMKHVDHWFSSQNIIDLLQHVEDRRIILQQFLAYQDENQFVLFSYETLGTILLEPRGTYGKTAQKVIALDCDDGLSIAEIYDKGIENSEVRSVKLGSAWHEFIKWYKERSL